MKSYLKLFCNKYSGNFNGNNGNHNDYGNDDDSSHSDDNVSSENATVMMMTTKLQNNDDKLKKYNTGTRTTMTVTLFVCTLAHDDRYLVALGGLG